MCGIAPGAGGWSCAVWMAGSGMEGLLYIVLWLGACRIINKYLLLPQ